MKKQFDVNSIFEKIGKPFLREGSFLILYLFVVLISVWVGFLQIRSPEALPLSADQEEFSSERALGYLEEIASKPRPLGSEEHDRVRDYLMMTLNNLGVSPELQTIEGTFSSWGQLFEGKVENIVARIRGKDSSQTIMITSHYDSVPNSPGAGDSGSGVASILETVRAITNSQLLKNDIVILFSDGEESGLLGAQAFVQYHPWAKDIDIVLNFDARGTSGPSVLFEMNDQNENIVAEFTKGATHPITHSLFYELYQRLPNDTDLSVYKHSGMLGMNFAFFVGLYGYHTPEDTIDNLNLNSLQHHGGNMLDLVRHFGNLSMIEPRDGNSVFFNVLGKKVITYSEQLVLPIMVLAIILYVLTYMHGTIRKKLTLSGTGLGFLIFLITVTLAFFAGEELFALLALIVGLDLWPLTAYPTISNPLFIGIILIVLAPIIVIYFVSLKKFDATNLSMGGFFGWLILVIISSVFFKGSSYVFVWPLIMGLLAVNLYLYIKKESDLKERLFSLGVIILPFIIVAPIIYLLYSLLTLKYTGLLIAITSLLTVFVIPALNHARKRYLYMVPTVVFSLGLLILIGCFIMNN